MARKVSRTFKAMLEKNTLVEKGGAWLLNITMQDEGMDGPHVHSVTAWANASAAKRWLKTQVLDMTPRKSIKLEVKHKDANDKPLRLEGSLTFKTEA